MSGVYGILRSTLETCHKGEVVLAGRFRPNGASTPTVWYGNWISSIAHTATGVWTVTIKPAFRGMVGHHAAQLSLMSNALVATAIQFGAIDWSAGTIIIRGYTTTSGAAADIASNANTWIDLLFVMKYMKIPDGDLLVT